AIARCYLVGPRCAGGDLINFDRRAGGGSLRDNDNYSGCRPRGLLEIITRQLLFIGDVLFAAIHGEGKMFRNYAYLIRTPVRDAECRPAHSPLRVALQRALIWIRVWHRKTLFEVIQLR